MTSTNDDRAARWRTYRAALSPAARARHMEALAVRREARESRLRAKVDAAVAEALKNLPQMLAELTETVPQAGFAESAPEAPAAPVQALHGLDQQEWQAYAATHWAQALPQHRPGPATISELIAGYGAADDGGE